MKFNSFLLTLLLFSLIACAPKDGKDGAKGNDGDNGHSIAFSVGAADSSVCSNDGSVISMGRDSNDDTILQASETTQVAVLCNGLDGEDGTDGTNAPPTAFTPVAIVNPCGDAPTKDDEVFLRLQNGMLLWSQSDKMNGNNTRLSLGRPGTWQTTDGDSCVFTLDASLTITYESHLY